MHLFELAWPQVDALDRRIPVVFPIAALEQHGHHLPLFTDSLLLGEVVRRASELVGNRVLFTPLTWFGNSEHHLDFPGSMSASPRVYLDSLRDMAENFLKHGFTNLLFLNGHGGNIVPAQQATFELRQKYRSQSPLQILSSTYWTAGVDPVGEIPGLHQNEMGHACEWETSMILRLAPHLVRSDITKIEDVPFGKGFEGAHRAWVMPDRSVPGHIGYPRLASPEKGEALFRCFSKAVAALLERAAAWKGERWE
jgi:creatinine amidohydrolase